MSVKVKAGMFRNLLYVKEVAEAGSISAAAEKNGIKPSNLSKLLNETESMFGHLLFCRTKHGAVPTKDGLMLAKKIIKLEEALEACLNCLEPENKPPRLYMASGIEIQNLADFQKLFLKVESENEADVIVSNFKPQRADELVSTKNRIGRGVVQNIWVCAENVKPALELARFIILQIHNQ
ncbi:MAG: LysR family transcriptional regulator [Alphaproteobacteria bacterium]|nr:LysR family transcriptional regulator [Alphaproteobacteria bacterium]